MSNELKVGDRVAATGESIYGLPVKAGALGEVTQVAPSMVRVLLDEPISDTIGTGDGGDLLVPGVIQPGWTFHNSHVTKVEG